MPFTFGRNTKFGLAKETTYNTFVRPGASQGISIVSGEFNLNREWMEEMSANSVPEKKLTDVVAGVQNCTAKITAKLPKEGLGNLLKNLFGTVADTAVGATFSGTQHIFSASNTTPASVSLIFMDDIAEYQLSGMAAKTVKISGKVGEAVMVEADFIGGTYVRAALGTAPTIPTTASTINPFWHFNDITTITAAGTVTTPNDWEYTVDCAYADGLAESYEIQTTTAAANVRKFLERGGDLPIKYTAVIKRVYQATTQIDKFIAATTGATNFELKQTSSSTGTSTGTNDYYMKIDMTTSLVKVHSFTEASDLITETLTIEGYQSAATDNQITYKDKQTVS